MKIAYCLDSLSFYGGIERVTIAKANALADIKDNLVYIIIKNNNKAQSVLPLNSKVKIINLEISGTNKSNNSLFSTYINLFKNSKQHKLKLTTIINQIQPDILISTNSSEKHFIKQLKLNYKPIIIREIHFCSNYRLIEKQSSFLNKMIAHIGNYFDYHWRINRIDHIVLLTNEDKELHWKNIDKVSVIPNPITSESPYPSSTTKEKRVIAAGRLTNQKNFQSLITAWKLVVEKHPDWILEIYGEGGLKIELEGLITKLNLNKHIFLKGKTTDIFKVMSNSSIYVLSSIYEGLPLVIIEAMSCGLPVVSYKCPCGPKDIITNGENGYLVNVNDEINLAYKINRIIEDEVLRKKMSNAAKLKAEEYNIKNITLMWMKLFKNLQIKIK